MSWLTNIFSPAKKQNRLVIGAQGLFDLIHNQIKPTDDCVFMLGDRNYVSLSDSEAFACVRNIQSYYRKEVNDCDDFSNLAKSEAIKQQRKGTYGGGVAAFGQVWLQTHAMNFYLDHSGKIRLINNDGSELPVGKLKQEPRLILA